MNTQRLQLGINKPLIVARRYMHLVSKDPMVKKWGGGGVGHYFLTHGRGPELGAPGWYGDFMMFTLAQSPPMLLLHYLELLLPFMRCQGGSSHPGHIPGRTEGQGKGKCLPTVSVCSWKNGTGSYLYIPHWPPQPQGKITKGVGFFVVVVFFKFGKFIGTLCYERQEWILNRQYPIQYTE